MVLECALFSRFSILTEGPSGADTNLVRVYSFARILLTWLLPVCIRTERTKIGSRGHGPERERVDGQSGTGRTGGEGLDGCGIDRLVIL